MSLNSVRTRLSLGIVSLVTIALVPTATASAAEEGLLATVSVYVTCNADGSYSYKGVIEDTAPYSSVPVYSSGTSHYSGGGSSSWGWDNNGTVWTGSYGIGSTNTMSQTADSSRQSVEVWVKINGTTGYGSDVC